MIPYNGWMPYFGCDNCARTLFEKIIVDIDDPAKINFLFMDWDIDIITILSLLEFKS